MAGAIITGTKTVVGIDSGSTLSAHLVKVYPSGGVGEVEVIIDLFRQPHAVEDFDRTKAPVRMGAAGLTRLEALQVIAGLQRALGIDPEALPRAIEAVDHAAEAYSDPDGEMTDGEAEAADMNLTAAYEVLHLQAALSTGWVPADER
jgi:hypothetical protein